MNRFYMLPGICADLRQFGLFFLGTLLCLYLVFSTALSVPYVAHDSIHNFNKFFNTSAAAPVYPLQEWEYAQGRPVGAVISTFVFHQVGHLSDLSKVRWAALLILALNAAWLASFAVSRGFAVIPAFCLSTAIFTLPGMQESVFVPYLTHALTIFFAFAAYAVWSSRWIWALRLITAMLLLQVAFLTYPALALVFLIPAMFVIIQENARPAAVSRCVRDIGVCLAGALAYYFIVKLFFYKPDQMVAGYQIIFSVQHLWMRTISFLTQVIPSIFNFWNVDYSYLWGGVGAVLVAAALLLRCFIDRNNGIFPRLFVVLGIFVTVNMLWFICAQIFLPRTFAASEAVCLLLFYWVVMWAGQRYGLGVDQWARTLAIVFLAIGLAGANVTVIRNVWNVNAELMFIRSRLVPYINSSTTEIRMIRPRDSSRGYHGFRATSDQFNAPTMGYNYDPPYLLRSALKDVYNPAEMHCSLSVLNDGQPAPAPDRHTVVVDMNDLVDIAGWRP